MKFPIRYKNQIIAIKSSFSLLNSFFRYKKFVFAIKVIRLEQKVGQKINRNAF